MFNRRHSSRTRRSIRLPNRDPPNRRRPNPLRTNERVGRSDPAATSSFWSSWNKWNTYKTTRWVLVASLSMVQVYHLQLQHSSRCEADKGSVKQWKNSRDDEQMTQRAFHFNWADERGRWRRERFIKTDSYSDGKTWHDWSDDPAQLRERQP